MPTRSIHSSTIRHIDNIIVANKLAIDVSSYFSSETWTSGRNNETKKR